MSTTPSTTKYDRYGRQAGYINPINNAVEAYLTFKAPDGTIYQCFYETGSDPRAISRIKRVGGLTQITIAWGVWVADAETLAALTFYPPNNYFEVDDETGALVHPTTPAPDISQAETVTEGD